MSEDNATRFSLKPGLIASAVAIALVCAMSAYAWFQLPEDARIPVHWGIDGQPDRYGSKAEGLLLTPAIALGIALLFSVIPIVEPRRINLRRSARAYTALWIGIMVFFVGIHSVLILAALGQPVAMNTLVLSGVGLLLILIGFAIRSVQSNFFMGIRTPWTLSSELSWNKTHRLGGKLFLLMGLMMLVLPWLPALPMLFYAAFILLFAAIIALVVYSYIVWKNDPDKLPFGR